MTLDGSNKTYSGATRVLSGALRGAGAEALSDASAVTVARGATLATGGDETVRSLDASGAVTLGGDLTAAGRGGVRGDLRFGGAVVAQDGRALTLSAGNLVASAAGNRWGDRLSVDVDGQVTLSAGTAGGAVRDLQIGSLRAGAGGRIRAGALAAVGPLQADGGRLELLASSIDLGGPVRIADATLVAQARTIETSASLEVVDGTLEWVAQQGLALGGVLRLQGSTADLRAESVSMGRVELVDSALEIAAQGNLQFRGAVDSRQSTIVGRGASVVIGDDLTLASGAVTLTATAERALGEPPADELLGLRVEGRQVAFSAAAIDQRGGRIDVAEDARLSLVAERGGSIELDATGNRFAGRIEARSGNAGTAWVNRIEQGFALQDRVVLQGGPVVVGAGGIEADVVDIGADTLATADGGRIVARLPFDNLVGTEASLPGLTLRLGEAAFGIAGSFGRPQGGAIEVSVGSRDWGGRTRFPDAGYLTVLPRGGARGSTAVILAGPEVRGGGYQFFFDGAGVLGEIPVFYNNFLPQTPQAVGSISAAVSVTESARRERFEEAVRTENVATRLRAGVIAEVGPGRPATEGAEGAKPPPACAPAGSTLSCAPR
ncbi:MAG: hypothetical protein MUF03_10645 [Rubrivivax sp.]|nr:hypothetical protein [Rubrivivax sp.]